MKGICFKEDLFKAVIAGTKTQTRRLIKIDPLSELYLPLFSTATFKSNNDFIRVKPRYKKGETPFTLALDIESKLNVKPNGD